MKGLVAEKTRGRVRKQGEKVIRKHQERLRERLTLWVMKGK